MVAVFFGLLFRKPVVQLIARLRQMKIAGVEFGDLPELPEKRLPRLPAPADREDVPADLVASSEKQLPSPANDLANESSLGAVIAAWVRLEEIIYRSAQRLVLVGETSARQAPGMLALIERMRKAGVIDDETFAATLKVREIRNRVVHRPEEAPSSEQAQDYRDVIDELSRRLVAGTELARLRMLLKELGVTDASDITVGPLAATGTSASLEAARQMALARSGQWIAKSAAVSMMVSKDDASLLIQGGARLQQPGDPIEALLLFAEAPGPVIYVNRGRQPAIVGFALTAVNLGNETATVEAINVTIFGGDRGLVTDHAIPLIPAVPVPLGVPTQVRLGDIGLADEVASRLRQDTGDSLSVSARFKLSVRVGESVRTKHQDAQARALISR